MYIKAFLAILFINSFIFAQDYSDQWEGHFSYLNISGIATSEDHVLASSQNTIFKHNTQTQNNTSNSTINGLTGETISYYYYSETEETSVIGYENGLVDIVTPTQVLTVVDIFNKPSIAPNMKRINHIFEHNGVVYLSCDFGISTYNLENLEFDDSYFIGNSGEQISVKQTTVKDDYIYAATSQGIKRAELNDANIIDYSLWEVLPSPTTDWKNIVTFNNTIYAIDSNNTLYEYNGTSFNNLTNYATVLDHRANANHMIITTANNCYVYENGYTNTITIPYQPTYQSTFTVAEITNNTVYIGTENDGIYSFNLSDGSNLSQIKPNGLLENNVFTVNAGNDEAWAVYGNHSLYFNPFPPKSQGISHLFNDSWNNTPFNDLLNTRNIIDVAINPFNPDQVFLSSFFDGLLELNNNVATTLFSINDLPLDTWGPYTSTPSYLRIGKSTFDNNGKLWFTNGKVSSPLKSYDPQNNTWQSFDFLSVIADFNAENGFEEIVIDQNNTKWIGSIKNGVIGMKENSGGVQLKKLNVATGNLPADEIRGLAIDNDNNLWVGTRLGLRVLYNTSGFFSSANPQAESVIILDDGIPKELMFGQFITDIEVDGANNKWIATFDAGVFYLSANGQETIYHFTKDNSPLPSNGITDMAIDHSTGEVYFATEKGMVSFNSNATASATNLENVYAFPNPVRPEHMSDPNFRLKIRGLVDGSNLKITDISGNLVYETTVTGGTTFDWNMTAFGSHKVASGVYIIMVTTKDNEETTIEKVMVVN
ncbi:MAG: two-component regulator propeller domain-containing protein [Flavobacteriaceae bacterium]